MSNNDPLTIIHSDALSALRGLESESVQCCVTSPPYWGLRDYGVAPIVWGGAVDCSHEWGSTMPGSNRGGSGPNGKNGYGEGYGREVERGNFCECGAWRGCLGLEPTPELYVAHLVEIFRELKRVLRADGTLWLNLGDSYAGSGKGGNPEEGKQATNRGSQSVGVLYGKTGETARIAAVTNVTRLSREIGLKPKDLVGIPWAVAKALRDPYYAGRIKDERWRYWLAGLVDGEGCLTILETTSPHGSGNSFPPVLQVRMCDLAPVAQCAAITGLGCGSPEQNPPSQGGQRGSYQWRLSARNAADIAAELYPYLMVKKRQALIVWNQQKIRESYLTKKGVKIPIDALEKQKRLKEIVQALNANQPVDLPSWLEEPRSFYEDGWYLRSDVIWAKPNPMPESVTDRPTKSHEYIFLLSKSERYYYNADAIAEPVPQSSLVRAEAGVKFGGNNLCPDTRLQSGNEWKPKAEGRNSRFHVSRDPAHAHEYGGKTRSMDEQANPRRLNKNAKAARDAGAPHDYPFGFTRNKRSVWTVATQAFAGAHFATFPPDLIKPCILAGAEAGATVLDPFAGSGTTGKVAIELGRKAILIEPKAEYIEMIKRRCQTTIGLPLAI